MPSVLSGPVKSRARSSAIKLQPQNGASLIELVVSIVLFAIVASTLASFFFNQSVRSVQPILQIRAAAFGQALMDEILSKPYDETTPVGGVPPCGPLTIACSSVLGAEAGESRFNFDDVDDYHSYCAPAPPYYLLENIMGEQPDNFDAFEMSVCVYYDGDYDGALNETGATELQAKLIVIDIYPPAGSGLGDGIRFSAYRSNF